jgi:myo-inositol 2-dehydrogenase/D-chiro-inositol 1-dehydrogenase
VVGSRGVAEAPYAGPLRIIGENAWTWTEHAPSTQASPVPSFATDGSFANNLALADREKDRGFIDSIASGNFHNQVTDGVESALTAMLGRMAGQVGREVTWQELLDHGEEYTLNIDMSQFR